MVEMIEIQPVLIGADINVYSVARAFHERYGVKSIAYGRMLLGAIKHSRIINFRTDKDIFEPEHFVETMRLLGEKLQAEGKTAFLIGCSDPAVEMIIDNKQKLEDLFIMPYIDRELKDNMLNKKAFYALCDEHGMPHPDTAVHRFGEPVSDCGLRYPIVVKPTNTILYWEHRFQGIEKVYYVNNLEQLNKIVSLIYEGGYDDDLIFQEFIPGDDTKIWTPTYYSDKHGRVKMMTLGHVLLEEHVPTARGNDAAILVQHVPELMQQLKSFLEAIGYIGFCNCDMKYDERDGKYKMFEVNIRQGRSNYHVTACGNNIAELLVEDYIHDRELPLKVQEDEFFWSLVPHCVVKKHVKDKALMEKVRASIRKGRFANTMYYDKDLKLNFKRRFYLFLYSVNQIRKFNRYYKQNADVFDFKY